MKLFRVVILKRSRLRHWLKASSSKDVSANSTCIHIVRIFWKLNTTHVYTFPALITRPKNSERLGCGHVRGVGFSGEESRYTHAPKASHSPRWQFAEADHWNALLLEWSTFMVPVRGVTTRIYLTVVSRVMIPGNLSSVANDKVHGACKEYDESL